MTAASGPVVSAWPHLFTEGAAGSPVLISLHGTGGTEHDGVALARELAADLVDVYQQRTRGVYRVPYDPALVAGSVVPYAQLSDNTRMQWLKACAGMAEGL